MLAIIFFYNLYRAFHTAVPALFVKFIFPLEYFGSLLGFVRFALGLSRLISKYYLIKFFRYSVCQCLDYPNFPNYMAKMVSRECFTVTLPHRLYCFSSLLFSSESLKEWNKSACVLWVYNCYIYFIKKEDHDWWIVLHSKSGCVVSLWNVQDRMSFDLLDVLV